MIESKFKTLTDVLKTIGPAVVACSGGLDSLLLAVLEHRIFPEAALIVHALGPAVPKDATRRVLFHAREEGWRLESITAGEFEDERYLANPLNRCYFCKSHLYAVLGEYGYDPGTGRYGRTSDPDFCRSVRSWVRYPVLSGANTDDLQEYRPGLDAARDFGVRHPFIESGISKEDVRGICRKLHLPFAELASSPCLSSRIYTGTRVSGEWLRLIDQLETELKFLTGARVVRCRLKEKSFRIEVLEEDRMKFTEDLILKMRQRVLRETPGLEDLSMDPEPYKPGRSFMAGS